MKMGSPVGLRCARQISAISRLGGRAHLTRPTGIFTVTRPTVAALALWKQAGNQGHGPSALAMGELYDPLLWGQIPSPFSKPNGIQAEKWYRRASTLGVAEANARLQKLEVWKREQPAADHQQ